MCRSGLPCIYSFSTVANNARPLIVYRSTSRAVYLLRLPRNCVRVTFSSQEEPIDRKAWNWQCASASPSICLIYCLFAPKRAARAFYAEPAPAANKQKIGSKQKPGAGRRKDGGAMRWKIARWNIGVPVSPTEQPGQPAMYPAWNSSTRLVSLDRASTPGFV